MYYFNRIQANINSNTRVNNSELYSISNAYYRLKFDVNKK